MNNLKFKYNKDMKIIEIFDKRFKSYTYNVGYYVPKVNYVVFYDQGHYLSDIEQIIDSVKKEKSNETTWGITYKVNGDDGYKELCDTIGKVLVIDDAITFLRNYHKAEDKIKIVKIEKIN